MYRSLKPVPECASGRVILAIFKFKEYSILFPTNVERLFSDISRFQTPIHGIIKIFRVYPFARIN